MSVTLRLYASPEGSVRSLLIWQTASALGSILRSSAKMGAPLKPSGFFSLARKCGASWPESPKEQLMALTS
jgi:hypothetical protein